MTESQSALLDRLRENNSETIHSVEDEAFGAYGRTVDLPDAEEMTLWAEQILSPDGPVYVPHYAASDNRPWKKALEQTLAGGMPLEIGSCCGANTVMNGMEYHKGHEYILALTPLVLFLGFSGDIRSDWNAGWTWDSSQGRFFFVPRGTAVELYSTTLHLAPCRCGREDFQSLIILPAGTNLELESPPPAGSLLFKRNKWMICHPDAPAAAAGACAGISGENRRISPLDEDILGIQP